MSYWVISIHRIWQNIFTTDAACEAGYHSAQTPLITKQYRTVWNKIEFAQRSTKIQIYLDTLVYIPFFHITSYIAYISHSLQRVGILWLSGFPFEIESRMRKDISDWVIVNVLFCSLTSFSVHIRRCMMTKKYNIIIENKNSNIRS